MNLEDLKPELQTILNIHTTQLTKLKEAESRATSNDLISLQAFISQHETSINECTEWLAKIDHMISLQQQMETWLAE